MTLYRALYQAKPGQTCRRMTFAAPDQRTAEQVARDWQIDACAPLIVRPLWNLQDQLELRP